MKEKYYDDPKENAAFLRHVDVVTNMILKYGPALKRKWAREALFNTVWMDCFFKETAVKRYMAYKLVEKIIDDVYMKTGSYEGIKKAFLKDKV